MAHLAGSDRSQRLLLPETVDDYIGPNHSVRFIEAFVDGLDLSAAGFGRVEAKGTGRPGYAPAALLKLYIYGYLNRIRSSRRLETETPRNLEVIWLLRHLHPDFRTIADFRLSNRKAFRGVFQEFVLLCRSLDLFGRELLAVDGTRIKAVNNKGRNFTRASLTAFIKQADERLEKYLQQLDQRDHDEEGAGNGLSDKTLTKKIAAIRDRRARNQAMLAELERTGENQISLTDPDSRAMAAHTRVGVGYNVQIAVDVKHKLIVEQQVSNHVIDLGLLAETAGPAREILGVEEIDVVADRGYFRLEDIEACEAAGIVPYVPKPQRGSAVSQGFFGKDDFRYDSDRDVYICPGQHALAPLYKGTSRGLSKTDYSNRKACYTCVLRPQCTGHSYRRIFRFDREEILDRMADRLAKRPEVLDQRRNSVEHPFGTIKQWMNQGAFLMRGLDQVRGEFSLTALAYNLRRVINILGIAELMTALQARQEPFS